MLVRLERIQVAAQRILDRRFKLALLSVLAAVILVRGAVPPLFQLDSDFPNYLTAAKIVAEGGDTTRLYDDAWFSSESQRHGMSPVARFTPFPPPTALLMIPLAPLEPLHALRVMTAVNILCLVGVIFLLARSFSWSLIDSALYVFLSGFAIVNGLLLGQVCILISFFCALGYYFIVTSRPVAAGVCFGLFAPIKYFPGIFLFGFALVKRGKPVIAGAVAIVVVTAISVAVLGFKVHEIFLQSTLGNHLVARMGAQDPFAVAYQSFDSLYRRLFVFDATNNPHAPFDWPALQVAALVATKALLATVTAMTLLRLFRMDARTRLELSVGLLGIAIFLIAPATATYHLALLWLPVAFLIDHFVRNRAPRYAAMTLVIYAAIGMFPYRLSNLFIDHGLLTIFAYPRLLLLLAQFCIVVRYVGQRTVSGVEPESARSTATR